MFVKSRSKSRKPLSLFMAMGLLGGILVVGGVPSVAVADDNHDEPRPPGTGINNPNLAASCGTDVILILDESGSISSAGAVADVEIAVQALVSGLKGTGSRMRIAEFSTNARDASIGGSTAFQVVDATYETNVNTYLGNPGNAQLANNYNPGSGEVFTNWEAGLFEAASPGSPLPNAGGVGAPLVVFITDGNPNSIGTGGGARISAGNDAARTAAIEEMAALQAAGNHVLSIAVGNAFTDSDAFDRLINITEPNPAFLQVSPPDPFDIRTTDVLGVSDFDDLDEAIRTVIFALCSPSVSITKVDDAGTPVIDDPTTPAVDDGWPFTLTVASLAGTGAPVSDQPFVWVSPNDGDSTAPDTKTVRTNSAGVSLFQWTPNTLADPRDWTSSATFTETLAPGWTIDPTSYGAGSGACNVERLNLDGSVTNLVVDLIKQSPAGTPVPGETITFSFELAGQPFPIGKADIVTCTVVNNRPATIEVVKDLIPSSDSGRVDLSIGATTVATNVGDGGEGSVALPVGDVVTVAEVGNNTDLANYTSSLACTGGVTLDPNTGTSGSFTVPASAAGTTITCTFTNTKAATITVAKETLPDGDPTEFTFETDFANSGGADNKLTDGESFTSVGLAAGSYNIVETVPTGWRLTDASCVGGTINDDGEVTVVAGDNVTCTFTNTKNGSITIIKDVTNTNDGESPMEFTFTGDLGAFGLTDNGVLNADRQSFTNLAPGTFNVVESNANTVGFNLDSVGCGNATLAGPLDDGVSVELEPGEDVTCTFVNEAQGDVSVTKTALANQPVVVDSDSYTVAYDIDVTNAGPGQTGYTLTDTPDFGAGATITNIAISGAATIGDYTAGTNIVTNDPINGGATETYTVTVTFDVSPTMTGSERSCEGDNNGQGTYNSAGIVFPGGTDNDYDCVNIPDPEVSVTKTALANQPVVVDSDTYTVAYDIDVTNAGPGQTSYTLTDTPDFGAGATITNIAISGAATIGDYTAGTNIVTNDPINGGATETYTVTVTFDVSPTMTSSERACEGDNNGQGTYNSADITFPGGTDNDYDCVNIPDPDVSIAKTVTSVPSPVALGSLSWTVGYEIVITNNADGPATYDLDDVPGFASGVTITAQLATSSDITVNGDFNAAVGNTRIANDVEIGGQETQEVSVVVTFDYTGNVDPLDRECGADPSSGEGTYNNATVTPNIGDPKEDDACEKLPDPDVSIEKTVSSKATLNPDGTYNVSYEVEVSNAANAGTGSYDLADVPAFSRGLTVVEKSVTVVPNTITTDPTFNATDQIVTGEEIAQGVTHTYTVTVQMSAAFTPDITYVECDGDISPENGLYNSATVTVDGKALDDAVCTDLPGDLLMEKTDGDVTVIAGGAPFTYTLSVTNVGGVSTGEPVTVTDVLPAEFEWVSFPEGPHPVANCVQTGQTLTCDIDPKLVDVGGESTSFEVTAQAKAGTTPSTDGYENLSYVSSPHDPAPEVPVCPTDEVVAEQSQFNVAALIDNLVDAVIGGNPANNVACDLTPVIDSEIEVTKLDNVANGDTVVAGESYTYTLAVENTGASPVSEVTLADNLPASLTLVSVNAGAGWTCNATDPLACTYAGELAAGATTSDVVLTVKIADSYAGNSIDNTVNSSAVVKTTGDSKTVNDSASEVTPLIPPADLEIIKTASVPTPGQGSSFDWNLTVTNNGPATATDVEVFDLVPSTLTVTGVTSSDFTCSNNGNTVTCTRAELTAGSSGDITIKVTVLGNTVGRVLNSAEVTAQTPDPDPTNNVDSAEVEVPAAAVAPPVVVPPAGLPATGADVGDFLRAAMLLLGAGLVFVLLSARRRRNLVS